MLAVLFLRMKHTKARAVVLCRTLAIVSIAVIAMSAPQLPTDRCTVLKSVASLITQATLSESDKIAPHHLRTAQFSCLLLTSHPLLRPSALSILDDCDDKLLTTVLLPFY